MNEFQYAPGMPGYGTRGIDGSVGLPGLAMYFSEFNGFSDIAAITNKIVNNKVLFTIPDETLPNYPNRLYVTGDLFIDKNTYVFEIDLSTSNLFVPKNISLNTSGAFVSQIPRVGAPTTFERFSNKFDSVSDRLLIDNILAWTTPGAGGYAVRGDIYENATTDYGKINYVGDDVMTAIASDYYLYQTWTNGGITTDDHIALVREKTGSNWHLGNKTSGIFRDVNLSLDFKQLNLGEYLAVDTSTLSLNYPLGNTIDSSSALTIKTDNVNNNLSYDITVTAGSVLNGTNTEYVGGGINIETGKGGDRTTGGSSSDGTGAGGNLNIILGDGGDRKGGGGTIGYGGSFEVTGGTGGDASTSGLYVALGGGIRLKGGQGGPGINNSGIGGPISLIAGNGGEVDVNGSIAAGAIPGRGGQVNINSGHGIEGDTDYGTGGQGSTAGNVVLSGGDGGDGSQDTSGSGGDGGNIVLTGGDGGVGHISNLTDGGYIQLIGGYNGNNTIKYNVYAGTTIAGETNKGGLAIGDGYEGYPSLRFASDENLGFLKYDINAIGLALGYSAPDMIGFVFKDESTYISITGRERPIKIKGETTTLYRPDVYIEGGDVSTGTIDAGFVYIKGGEGGPAGSGANGGDVNIDAGDGDVAGDVIIRSGDIKSASQGNNIKGDILIHTFESFGTAGNIKISSASGFGTAGDIELNTTSPSGTAGDVSINIGAGTNATTQGRLYINDLPMVNSGTHYVTWSSTSKEVVASAIAPSDKTLKTIQSNLINTLDNISNFDTIRYIWNDKANKLLNFGPVENDPKLGLIAQDVEEFYPELVSTKIGANGEKYKYLDYQGLIPVLISGINELKDIVDKQQEQINQLLNK